MNPEDRFKGQTKCPSCLYESRRESKEEKEEDLINHIKREHIELLYGKKID